MNISLAIHADDPRELTEAIKTLAAAYGASTAQPATALASDAPEPSTPKKTRAKSDAPAKTETPPVGAPKDSGENAPSPAKIDVAEVRQAISGLLKATTDADTANFLKKFGASRLSELKESDYPQIIAEAQALIAAAASAPSDPNVGMMD